MTEKSNFDVKITEDHGGLYLSITHNGYQWTSIALRKPKMEIPRIIAVLQDYLKEMP